MAQVTPASAYWRNYPSHEQWHEFVDRFADEYSAMTAAQSPWVGTALAAGTFAFVSNLKGGAIRLANAAATNNSGYQIQGDMETLALTQGKQTQFMIRLRTDNPTNVNFFVGLAVTDTTVLAATDGSLENSLTASHAVGFLKPSGEAGVYAVIVRSDTRVAQSGSLATLSADQWAVLSFTVTMNSATAAKGVLRAFVNGVDTNIALASNTMPYDGDTTLTPTIAMASRAASDMTLDVDDVGARMER